MRAENQFSRRAVLGWCGLGMLTVVAGCSDDPGSTPAPDPDTGLPADPSASTPSPEPEPEDAALLVAALDRARLMVMRTEAVGDDLGIAGIALEAHTEQVRILEGILTEAGVTLPPEPTVPQESTTGPDADSATGTGPPPDDSSATSQGPGDREREAQEQRREALDLLGSEAAADVTPQALATLATASPTNLALLISIAGQRGALAMRLGIDPEWEDLEGPAGQGAADLLEVFRPAVYGFEVLAARASGEYRERYERALAPLRRLTRSLTALAGDAAPPAPLGYGLPDDLGSAPGRRALAVDLLSGLLPTILSGAGGHTGDQAAVSGAVRLVSEVVMLGRHWEIDPFGFPGMDVPAG